MINIQMIIIGLKIKTTTIQNTFYVYNSYIIKKIGRQFFFFNKKK